MVRRVCRGWAMGTLACGLACVGIVFACVLAAIPERGVARHWPVYAMLLLGPYLVAAAGVAIPARHRDEWRFARICAVAVAMMGLLGAVAVCVEAAGVLLGASAPAVPVSGFAVALGLLPQYGAGVGGYLAGRAGR